MWKGRAQNHLDTLPSIVLGYVSTRVNGTLLVADTILNGPYNIKPDSVLEWYTQFGQNIDGIYFDEIVIPEEPASVSAAVSLVAQFKHTYPSAKAMILAGQCIDEQVVGQNIDWTLMWEEHERPAYLQNFYPLVNDPQSPGRPIPAWWKNPDYRQKIVHVIHDCPESDRQYVIGLANERNAGHIFVMDRRGLSNRGLYELYDHLPPYWDVEVREANSYYDFGFVPRLALLAAHRYGVAQGKLHAWPNFEAAWYGANHVRGTFLLDAGPHATQRDVLQTDLPGAPSLFDIPAVWYAVHRYAQRQGFETALPTFEQIQTPNGVALRIVLFATGLPWLIPQRVPLVSTYQQPTFAEPGAVVRNINRWATSNGHKASFPTFEPDDPNNPRGRSDHYNCYVMSTAAPVTWQDVPTAVYLQYLGPLSVVPDVTDMRRAPAAHAIRAAGLVPAFAGSTGPRALVSAQSPDAGIQVVRGSTVTCELETEPRGL